MFKNLLVKIAGWFRRHRIFTLHLIMVLCLLLQAAGGFAFYSGARQVGHLWQENKGVVANLMIAIIAHQRAGEDIPFKANYYRDHTWWVWGTFETNSYWVSDNTFMIVPMIVYEGASLGAGVYPKGIGFAPNVAARSIHVAGTAYPDSLFIYLNDRYVIDKLWNDEASAIRTLTHELVHIQRGNFFAGYPEDYESHTSAVTTEIMAAMCNQGNAVACRAFWDDVQSMARSSLLVWAIDHGLGKQYQALANLLFRDAQEEQASAKAVRYWAGHQEEQRYIAMAYSVRPWYQMIVPGALNPGYRLSTGLVDWTSGSGHVLGMAFDDSAYLLSSLRAYLKWLPSWNVVNAVGPK